MRFTVTVDPSAEVTTSADAVLRGLMRLEADETDQDDVIDAIAAVARQRIESFTGRRLITQTVEGLADGFPQHSLDLPIGPIQSISSVEYAQMSDGAFVTLDVANWRFVQSHEPGNLEPSYGNCWPDARDEIGNVRVTMIVGYGDDATALPADLLHAVRMLTSHYYQNREDMMSGEAELPPMVRDIVDPAYCLWFGN